MKTKHTPGPWHVNAIRANRIVGDETEVEFDKLQIHGANCTIATVYHRQDARLIASAPDLLAERDRLRALNAELLATMQEIADTVALAIKARAMPAPMRYEMRAIEEVARAAIAKIKG